MNPEINEVFGLVKTIDLKHVIKRVVPYLKHGEKSISLEVFNRYRNICKKHELITIEKRKDEAKTDKDYVINEDLEYYARSILRYKDAIKRIRGLNFEYYNYGLSTGFAGLCSNIEIFIQLYVSLN